MSSLQRHYIPAYSLALLFFCAAGMLVRTTPAAQVVESIKVYVRAADGSQLSEIAQVSLLDRFSQVVQQATTRAGYTEFYGVRSGGYTLEVVAAGYEKYVESLDLGESGGGIFNVSLQPSRNSRESHAPAAPPLLSPTLQKELAKSSEALRANNLKEARNHLDAAYRLAPNNPEVNYLFGLYFAKTSDWTQAKSYWQKTLSLSPEHQRATLALGEALIREKSYSGAIQLLKHAAEMNPEAWRPHALLAEAYLHQALLEESIQQSERALELGHTQALFVQPILVRALLEHGDKQRAIEILRAQVQSHPDDLASKKQLEALENASPAKIADSATTPPSEAPLPAIASLADAAPVTSNWLPRDIDEQIPPVLPNRACDLNDVLPKAAARIQELVKNVEKYTATEFLVHESINKWGLVSNSENQSFNYLVSIREIRPGALSVEEERAVSNGPATFPDHIRTNGLPSLPLIFHPFYSGQYLMTCEGITNWNGSPAYQVHFRQRPDQPNTMRAYRIGVSGQAYPVALKGRAWISARSYQLVRMEATLMEPIPLIQLYADFTIIEYGPVHFKKTNEDMWLPMSVEYYYDWKGKRAHRHHKFDNYLLFSVDDKQRISDPKHLEPSPNTPVEQAAPSVL